MHENVCCSVILNVKKIEKSRFLTKGKRLFGWIKRLTNYLEWNEYLSLWNGNSHRKNGCGK